MQLQSTRWVYHMGTHTHTHTHTYTHTHTGTERLLPATSARDAATVNQVSLPHGHARTQAGVAALSRRVLARISKVPDQNSKFKIPAHPDLATSLLQILIPATISSLVCQKGQYTLQLCLREYFFITPEKSRLINFHRNFCLSKQVVFRKLPVQKTGRTGPG